VDRAPEEELTVDRPQAQPQPPPSNTPLALGKDLKAKRRWGGIVLVRLVAVLAATVGVHSLRTAPACFRQVAKVVSEASAGASLSPEWLQSAFSDLGLAPTVHHAILSVAGVLLVLGGVLGIFGRRRARRIMLWGLGVLILGELTYALLPHVPLVPPWLSSAVKDVDYIQLGVLLAVCAGMAVFLWRADRVISAASDDVFANVSDLVQGILEKAVDARASDVHIEPSPVGATVRYRVDGVLHPVITYPPRAIDRIASRIKVLANMDIAERRMPQDGGVTLPLRGRSIDLRISTVPSSYGERVVARILDRERGLRGLKALGMRPDLLERMSRIVGSPHGVFFCTGPTGSGKTTTLYAALLDIDRGGRNVITVEDPIEYHLPGITQLPVGAKKGMTFASGLRSILRQDPDVIMVGEVRDAETAKMVIQAAQTGHLVLSTVHTNDSAGAVSRLLDLEAEPPLLASSLMAVLAQRLVRCICPECAVDYAPSAEELASIDLPTDGSIESLHRGTGCGACMQTGYIGREGLFELLIVDRNIRDLINQRADSATINEQAVAAGMVSLREDGRRKALAGVTTVEEVARVTQGAILR
jgi:type II secretory ATPase GspE/PulE/Tfp pilus assembly ATPase PilB-like protein